MDRSLRILDELDDPILVYDRKGDAQYANRAARERLDDSLLATIANALRAAANGARVAIERSGTDVPLYLTFIRMEDVDGAATAVIVTDPARVRPIDDRLRALFGLTAGEMRFARIFLAAGSLPRTAAALAISAETARTHLKRIFAKTGTTSQAQLLLLLDRIGLIDVK
ncbi:MAG: hypothetical protein NVSMB64_04470 [Candidatus Velthaea sp.]